MKKYYILALLIFIFKDIIAQPYQLRNDAGLQGNAGAVSGFFETSSPTNYPTGATSYWHLLDVRHGNLENNYAMQIAGSFFNQEFWVRKTNDNPSTLWSRMLTESPNGRVGIGTTNPQNALHIAGAFNNIGTGILDGNDRPGLSISGNYPQLVLMAGGTYNNTHGATISLGAFDSGTSGTFKSWTLGTPGANATYMDIGYGTSSNPHANGISDYGNPTLMRIRNDGNVGIGTLVPSGRLDVSGSVLFGGHLSNLDAGYYSTNMLANTGKLLIGWNRLSGFGETDFIANQGLGASGGFAFFNHDNNNVESLLMRISSEGNIGIGTANPTEKLSVNGTVRSKQVKVETTNWGDYVFEPTYELLPLTALKAYVDKHKHLPDVPSAEEIQKNGLDVGEMNTILMKKVEELTLYLIEKDKQLSAQEQRIQALEMSMNKLINKK